MNLRYCNWISVDFPLDIVAHFPTWRCILWLCNLQDPEYHKLSRLAIQFKRHTQITYANNRSKWDRKRLWKLHYGWYTILWNFQINPLAITAKSLHFISKQNSNYRSNFAVSGLSIFFFNFSAVLLTILYRYNIVPARWLVDANEMLKSLNIP